MEKYKECLKKAIEYNNKGEFENGIAYAEKAYKLSNDVYPDNYKALMQKKKGLEGLCREGEAKEVSKLIQELLWEDTKRRAEGEARKKHHLTGKAVKGNS